MGYVRGNKMLKLGHVDTQKMLHFRKATVEVERCVLGCCSTTPKASIAVITSTPQDCNRFPA